MRIPIHFAKPLLLICAVAIVGQWNGSRTFGDDEKGTAADKKDGAATQPAKDATPPKKEPTDSPPKKDEPKPDKEPAKVPSGEAAAAFGKLLGEWKDIIKSLRDVQERFVRADSEEQGNELRKTFSNLIEKGNKLLPQIRKVGIAAYLEAPNNDRELTRMLVHILQDEVQRDKYEPAFQLAETLVKNECEVPHTYLLAGIAAYGANNFEKAKEYLTKAKEADAKFPAVGAHSPDKIEEYLTFCDELKDAWTKEVEIREKEEKAGDLPRVRLTTSKGVIELELFENEAPDTVGNFISLVEKPFYENIKFHRVLPAFMVQTGCPNGDGSGGPGYKIFDECNKPNHRKHFTGSVSMAKTPLPDTGGSQFFICLTPTPHLNGKHTVFGRVIKGMDVVSDIQRVDPNDQKTSVEPDTIIKVEVLRKREGSKYVPKKVIE